MFERLDTPKQLFDFQLGSALTMEHDSLMMLKELGVTANADDVKELFTHHQTETQGQIENLERIFRSFDMQPDRSPSSTTKGMMKEGTSLIAKARGDLADNAAITAALGTEHYEISVYESLIIAAEAMGEPGTVDLLEENLAEEKHTSEELVKLARTVTARARVHGSHAS